MNDDRLAKYASHGVLCPGYARNQGALEFKNENNRAANRAALRFIRTTTYHGTEDSFGNAILSFEATANYKYSSLETGNAPSASQNRSVIPPSLISVNSNREQLYDTFIGIFNPKDVGRGSQDFDFMRMLAILAPSYPVLRDGLDALSLIQVGSAHRDQRLLSESISRHCKALRSTRQALDGVTFAEDALLANISVLTICELFDVTKGNPSSWFGHVEGFNRILLARGPDSLQSKLSMLVFYQSRYQALTRSLLRRKADPLSSPEWRAVLRRMPFGFAGECMDFALQVPELLERYDAFDVNAADALEKARELLSDCEGLRSGFEQWFVGLQQSKAGPSGMPYTILEVENFPTYAALVSDRTLSNGYHSANQKLTFLCLQYWCCMYFLRSTIAHLHAYVRYGTSNRSGFQQHVEEACSASDASLDDLVFSLCRCIPGLAERSTGAHGHTAMFLPLRVAGMHFESRGLTVWAKWVDNVRAHIFHRGIRPPTVKDGDHPVAKPLLGFTEEPRR